MNRCFLAAVLMVVAGRALATDPGEKAPCPAGGAITSGSSNVTVGGKEAARAGDTTGCGSTIVEEPAAVQGSPTGCGGSIVIGFSGVFINRKPMVAVGDAAGCAGK